MSKIHLGSKGSQAARASGDCHVPRLSGCSLCNLDISSSQLVAECVAKVAAEDSDEEKLIDLRVVMLSEYSVYTVMTRMDKPTTNTTFEKRRELPFLRSDDDDSDR
jgi:hypothetical protein